MALSMTRAAKNRRKAIRIAKRSIYDPGTQLSGLTLRGATRAITNQEYAPQIRAKKSEIAGLGQLGQQTGGRVDAIYMQLAKDIQGQLDQQKVIGDRLKSNVSDINTQAATDLENRQKEADQHLAQYGGIPAGGRSVLSDTLAAQRLRQSGEAAASSKQAENTAANYQTFGSNMAAAAQAQGAQAKTDIARAIAARTGAAQGELSDIRANRSNAYVNNLLKLRSGERDYSLAAATLNANIANDQAKIGLEQQKLGLTKQELVSKLATAKTVRAKNRAQADIFRYNLAHPHSPIGRTGSKSGSTGTIPQANRTNRKAFEYYMQLARSGVPRNQYTDKAPGGPDETLYKIAAKAAAGKRLSNHEIFILNNRYPGVTDPRLGANPKLNKSGKG